ncbi:uncharacterized protein LOC113850871 [Abrus precatorius]|uniref:Uncharacterized protein LOC113850871 n=1 Tax=Abrus precatorius TaxID=3816 RepID=A0A8B8K0F0_ABRPR|nr:uncharacterized protein LOC113850871 [Abrus precatorius]
MAKSNLQFQQNVNAFIQDLQTQIGQLATTVNQFKSQGSGQLPSQPEINPKNVSAIVLRSGKELLDGQKNKEMPCDVETKMQVAKPKLITDLDKELFETFRRVEVNIPLLDAIKQIPKYAKFLKEMCTNKRRLKGDERISMGRNVSLNLGPLKPTGVVIQLANRSTTHPAGVVEDVLVRVDKLIFPAYFYILDMAEESSIPTLILGRPFLKTTRTKIDVHSGILSMEFGDDVMHFNIFESMKHPTELHSVYHVDIIDLLVDEYSDALIDDYSCTCTSVELCKVCAEIDEFLLGDNDVSLDDATGADLGSFGLITTSTHTPNTAPTCAAADLDVSTRTVPSIVQPPILELKPLPKHLKYAFLEANDKLPVIVSADLDAAQEEKLLQILAAHK